MVWLTIKKNIEKNQVNIDKDRYTWNVYNRYELYNININIDIIEIFSF